MNTGPKPPASNEAQLRDWLALVRTDLANERTLLAYARTAVAIAATGVALVKFFEARPILLLGWTAIALAALIIGLGTTRYWHVRRTLQRGGDRAR